MLRLALLAVLVHALATLPVSAQEAPARETPVVALDSVVVTATRLPADARATGHHVTVLTARDLAALPAHDLQAVLGGVGGVEVQARGGFGVQADLTLRGATFNGVLLLLDAARLNDPMTGHFLTDLPLPLAELARVEVLRGPAAAAYGPDAVGGVIHLITHVGAGAVERAAEAGALAGSAGTALAEAHIRRPGRTAWSAAAQAARSAGEPIRTAEGPVVGPDGPLRTDFARAAASAAATRALGRARLYGRVGADRRDFSAFQFYTPFPSDSAREATATLWAQARLEAELDARTGLRAVASARQHEDTYVYNPQTPANRHTSRRATLLLEAHRTAGPLRLTAGLAGDLRGIESNNMGAHADASGGAFVTGHFAREPAALALGLRLDADPGYGLEPTGTLSAALTPARALTLRAAAGRAVRAPTYVERYFNTTLARPRGQNLGNPDLRAESAWTAEVGADFFPAPGLALRATAFARDTRNLIDFARLTPADTVFLAQNVLRVRTAGLEADARLRHALGGDRMLTLDAAYALLESALSGERPGAVYKYALTHACHRLSGGASLAAGPASGGIQARWQERPDGARFGTVDVRAAYTLPAGTTRVTLTAEVHNVLDARYTEVFGAQMPGRRLLAGLRLRAP